MSNSSFESMITSQFTEVEMLEKATYNIRVFLNGSETFGGSLESTFACLYQDLLEACGFDEDKVTTIINQCVGFEK